MIAREGHFPSQATTVVSEGDESDPEIDRGGNKRQHQLAGIESPANPVLGGLSPQVTSPPFPASPHNTPEPLLTNPDSGYGTPQHYQPTVPAPGSLNFAWGPALWRGMSPRLPDSPEARQLPPRGP